MATKRAKQNQPIRTDRVLAAVKFCLEKINKQTVKRQNKIGKIYFLIDITKKRFIKFLIL